MSDSRITIYTDGGCRPNPGPGGWGAVIDLPEGRRELSGSDPSSTNNRMELTAALRALESLPEGSGVDLVTDSTYLEQGITKWIAGWRRKGWVTSTREPVKNRDLWCALDDAARRHQVRWRWARGHAGHAGNERAHQLAAAAIPDGGRRNAVAVGAVGTPAGGASSAAATAASHAAVAALEPIEVFVAVAWSAARRVGSWGAVLRLREVEKELSGRVTVPSANAVHIASAALVLEAIRTPRPVTLVTVSDYLRDGATLWLTNWSARGWKTRDGQPVASRELWERLARQLARLPVGWEIAGQASPPPEIERARQLARAALES